MSKFYKISIFLSLFSGFFAFADGLRDLFLSGVTGLRAYLASNTNTPKRWRLFNAGVHYVYAKEGDKITLASSAQGLRAKEVDETTLGKISTSQLELELYHKNSLLGI